MTVDVVVVNYRSGSRLARALRVAQDFIGPGATLIVVDNSPGDGAAAAAAREIAGIEVLASPGNVGFAAAVNRAIKESGGDLVLLLNPDVSAIDGEFARIERIFVDDARVGAVGVTLRNEDGSMQPNARRAPRPIDLFVDGLGLRSRYPDWAWTQRAFYATPLPRVVDTVFGACLFLRREALRDVGSFDERFFLYAEETDWLVRAKRRGWQTVVTPEVAARHTLRGSTSETEETLSLLLLESNYAYASKHFGLARALALRLGLGATDAARWLRAVLAGREKRTHRRALERRLAVHTGTSARSPRLPGRRR